MRRALLISLCVVFPVAGGARAASAQSIDPAPSAAAAPAASGQLIDAVAARIEDDILTESQVQELAAFQKLIDRQAKPRAELIRELVDQWVVQGEAVTAKYPEPSQSDVSRAYQELSARFSSLEAFKRQCATAGLAETALRRILSQQLYLSRFLDYRFRPAAQVDPEQIATYYNNELAPQLKSRGEPVPPLENVEDSIREVLVQRAVSDRAKQWLDETRARLKIDVLIPEDHP